MDKKRKIILISGIAIVAVLVIIGIICLCVGNSKKSETGEEGTTSKLEELYATLSEKDTYSVTMTADENNKKIYAKQGNQAYTDSIYNGVESKFIIKNGNSYLLIDDSKACYTYRNNETDLNKIEDGIIKIKDTEHEDGEEKIENKKYKYEEYDGLTTFTIMDTSDVDESQEVKTRFYFDKNELVYIKTIIGEKQELLKVDISYDVDGSLFEIPSDYEIR